jgi:hypothetical protein
MSHSVGDFLIDATASTVWEAPSYRTILAYVS